MLQIKRARKLKLIPTKHFEAQCTERNLEQEEVEKIILSNKILGIVEQNQNKYKLWLSYKDEKDLHVIVSISIDGRLRIITVFPCYSERRLK